MSVLGNRNWPKILFEEDLARLLEDYRTLNETLDKILKVLLEERR